MRSQYEEGLWITSVRLGLSGQEDRVCGQIMWIHGFLILHRLQEFQFVRDRDWCQAGCASGVAGPPGKLHWLQVIHPAASRVTRTDVAVRGPDNLGHGRTVLQCTSWKFSTKVSDAIMVRL